MTTSTFTTIPLAIGASLAGLAGRGGQWCLERMAQSPMGSTAFVLVTGLSLMAGTNALYFQKMQHPAPMFSAGQTQQVVEVPAPPPVRPVVAPTETVSQPATQPQAQPAPAPAARQEAATPSIGNADIAEMQEKLKAMGMFDGTVDGYYGPKTADAIRAFEQRAGLPRTGAASPQVIEAVRRAPLTTSQAAPVTTTPAPQPMPQPVQATADPAAQELAMLIAEAEVPAQAAPVAQETVTAEPVLFDPTPATAEPAAPVSAALDRDLVSEIQRGLSRLGFLQAPVNGIPDETTALAIRKFQVFNNFPASGEVSTAVLDMLVAAGAYM